MSVELLCDVELRNIFHVTLLLFLLFIITCNLTSKYMFKSSSQNSWNMFGGVTNVTGARSKPLLTVRLKTLCYHLKRLSILILQKEISLKPMARTQYV